MTLLNSGCAGYRVGHQALYRPDVRTVYVPVFESESFRRNLGEQLTEAVIKEMEARTPFKVVHTPNADSVLVGKILSEKKKIVAEDRNDQPRDIETNLVVNVHWYDRNGGLIVESVGLPIAPLTVTVSQNVSFVPESGQSLATAHQTSIDRLARQIVSQMEVPW